MTLDVVEPILSHMIFNEVSSAKRINGIDFDAIQVK